MRISSDPAFLRRACTGAVEEAPGASVCGRAKGAGRLYFM